MPLDPTDKAILNQLQKNAKVTHKQLSYRLDLSVTAIYERVKKLERHGMIEKYTAVLNRKKLGRELLVLIQIKLNVHSRDNIGEFENEISKLEDVHECFHVSGDYDYILKATFSDMDEYREFLVKKLTAIPAIGSTHSIFVINEVKNEPGIRL